MYDSKSIKINPKSRNFFYCFWISVITKLESLFMWKMIYFPCCRLRMPHFNFRNRWDVPLSKHKIAFIKWDGAPRNYVCKLQSKGLHAMARLTQHRRKWTEPSDIFEKSSNGVWTAPPHIRNHVHITEHAHTHALHSCFSTSFCKSANFIRNSTLNKIIGL